MTYSLQQIAEHIDAQIDGDPDCRVEGMAELTTATARHLCFADSTKHLDALQASAAGACIVAQDFPSLPGRNLLRVTNGRLAFLRAMELFVPPRPAAGIHPTAVIGDGAEIDSSASIGAGVVIGDGAVIGARSVVHPNAYIGAGTRVGDDCEIHANACLQPQVSIGNRCILHPGVVIGADGYGFQWLGDHHHKIPQLGTVAIEDDVDIGANSCIDRATLGETRIGRGSKIDNLVQIGHNNRLGEHVLLVAQVGIAGSCTIGNGAVLGGQVGVADHLDIGAGARIGAQAGVTSNIQPGATIWGTPSRPMGRVLKELAALGKLPELLRQFRNQSREMAILNDRLAVLEHNRADIQAKE